MSLLLTLSLGEPMTNPSCIPGMHYYDEPKEITTYLWR